MDIGAEAPLRFPRKLRNISYTTNSRWRGKVVRVIDIEFMECKFNPPLADDDFKIDPSQAHVLTHLDTGVVTQLKKSGLNRKMDAEK